ncbi:MAG: hypothetical protein JHC41_06320 [Nitrosopumilus sp.]|jgi:hypothetical protein|nr:hypothetical protein [Nitrosopumilus sp.]
MRSSRKVIIIALVIGISFFAYFQFVSISQISMIITHNQPLKENEGESMYSIELEFNNPSLLVLTAGKTEFFITLNERVIGKGRLDPFVLPPLDKISVSGTYLKDSNIKSQENTLVKINGVTKYNVFFTTIDVPFVFYPTPEQAREFIQQD